MKKKLLCSLIITTIFTTIPTHAMEKLTIFSEKPTYGSLSTYEQQLKFPDDILYKIIAYCSHTTRCQLQETCKQLSFLASIDRLDKFLMHDFIIGNQEEALAFFNALIKNNNPSHPSIILNHAHNQTMIYNLIPRDDVRITFEPSPHHDNYTQEEFMQINYLNPLLKEAIKQKNDTMQDVLIQLGGDINVIRLPSKASQCYLLVPVGLFLTFGAIATAVFCGLSQKCK